MSKHHQFFTYKFNSSRLKEFDYNINITFDEARHYKEVIALFDNQMLRSIRDIHKRHVDENLVNKLKFELKQLKKQPSTLENSSKIREIRKEINNQFFIPEYITIVMDHPSHYKHLFEHKLKINGKTFVRFSCSAGQARVSTVCFVEEQTSVELDEILNNGRNLNKKIVPSKYNAYKGLSGSATQTVTAPRFCVVPDYFSKSAVKVNFVTETSSEEDDKIDVRDIVEDFNRFDGQGLISYEMASQWATDLGLDYVPAQWCIRQNFIKGMLNTFPIHEFCQLKNGENYTIETSYEDERGKPKKIDLRDVDVIISESQFKFWNSFDSVEIYQKNCEQNNLKWGVSLYSPKKDKDILKMNYQFLQTLNLNNMDVSKVCEKFVDWISGVTSENVYYTILFLLGANSTEEKIDAYMKNGENYWIKSLILKPELINDKYIKKKVYDLVKRKIKKGCLGEIIVDGNFQTLVSDPYAMMQHICGLKVSGLLGKCEYYSNYWNEKDVKTVDSMRAPLTFRSEHLLLDLKNDSETKYWYRYNYTGIIVNVHGYETMNWAGSDFDYDIIATTSDENIINGVYRHELPVVYEPPKAVSKHISDRDLFEADMFSFGSIIGQITNKSTTGYALLPTLKENTDEYQATINRIRMGTKLQSAQIDKAKIGREVKGIPSTWNKYQKVKETDSEDVRAIKEFNNSILLDKHPYFFIYLYGNTRSKYKKHYKSYDITSQQRFGMTLNSLLQTKRKTKEQRNFIELFHLYSPVIESDCVMNRICKYIESVDFKIKDIIKNATEKDLHHLFVNDHVEIDEEKYKKIAQTYKEHKKNIHLSLSMGIAKRNDKSKFDDEQYQEIAEAKELFKNKIEEICSNEVEATNYLIRLFYSESPSSNKDILWSIYGDIMLDNLRDRCKDFHIPVLDKNGDIEYLNKTYSLRRVMI